MFRLEKSFRFEASHQLPNYDGKCQRLHGHSWVGRVVLEDYELMTQGPKAGMVKDFVDVKAVLDPVIEKYLDHWHLNETLPLANPTSEEIAKWLFFQLIENLPQLVCVRIEETCTSAAEYWSPTRNP